MYVYMFIFVFCLGIDWGISCNYVLSFYICFVLMKCIVYVLFYIYW